MSSIWYYEPFYDIDRVFDDAWGRRSLPSSDTQLQRRDVEPSGAVRSLKPRMDLIENPNKNLVIATFELPGLKKEDVSIDVHNNRLTVSGEAKEDSERKEGDYAVKERRYGKFSRTLNLPQGVKDDEIKATMAEGVLVVTFPKASSELAPKKITVS